MKKLIPYLLLLLLCCNKATAQENFIAKKPQVITGNLISLSGPVKNFKKAASPIADITVRDEEGIIGEKEEMEEAPELPKFNPQVFTGDASLQKDYPNLVKSSQQANRAVTNDINGINYTNVNPPDPSIAAGPNHIIQMVNGASGALFTIYNKSGVQLVAQTYLDNITGKGGLGDPVVLYDQLANRFVMTEFVNKNEVGSQGLSIAVSQTADPTGSWYIYFFSTGTVMPDYPKFSVWADAYYAKTNDFNTSNNYMYSSIYAFDRNKMLAGNQTATVQVFSMGMGYNDYSMMPVLLQGATIPPSNTGGLFAYLQEAEWTGANEDSIGLLECKVDFVTPANSGITYKSSLVAANYKSMVCGANRSQCINQPGTSVMLEALDQRIMNQPVYRNFGSYEGIVFCNAVDNGVNVSGIRWYELIKTTGNWSIRQQSTYSPDNTHRFMPGICYDSKGNIALAYNVSSASVYPGIRYTGRKQCDAVNSMTYAENSLADGTASNINSRYGDYNQLVCDPDGLTFWFTGAYNTGSQWSSKIASFTLDTCVAVCNAPTAPVSSNLTISSATISWTGAGNGLNYTVDYKAASSGTWINAASATTAVSVNLTSLTAGTLYDWRVKTNCQSSASAYLTAQFTTTASVACNQPTALAANSVTTSGVTLSWAAVSGALKYAIDYKKASVTTWTSASTGQTTLTKALTGLTAGTLYDWRVKTICSTSAGNSLYSMAQFTTVPICPDQLETNNTLTAAKTIPTGTDVRAQIATSTDLDFYSFTNSSTQNNIRVTLTNLPANYDLKLFSPAGTLLLTSANTGTTNETINYNTTVVGTYKVQVYGVNKVFSNTSCYTLKAQIGSASFAPEIYRQETADNLLQVYPTIASQMVTISFYETATANTTLKIENLTGAVMFNKKIPVVDGRNIYQFDVSGFSSGVYYIKLTNNKGDVKMQKIVVAR
jgi:hypothetical protein